jgi:uncharacterized protein (TIGR02231 family)
MTLAIRLSQAAATLALITTTPSLAAEFPADSRPDAVTVFTSEAAVTRLGTVSVEPGEHTIRVAGLPGHLDAASLRVEAEAGFGLEIGAVDIRRAEAAPLPVAERSEIERQIAALEAERAVAEDAQAVGEARLRMAEQLAGAGGPAIAEALRAGSFNPAMMRDVVAAAAAEQEAAHAAIRGAKIRTRDLDIEIERLRVRLDTPAEEARPTSVARIAVTSKGAGPVKLKLTYRVPGARWTPVYEARLSTGAKPSLAFATRARIDQTTGEDWRDVVLTLSTTRPSRRTDPGTLPVLVGRFLPPMPPPRPMAPLAAAPAPESFMAKRASVADEAPEPQLQAAGERGADLVQTGTVVSYRVPGRVAVAATGEVKTLKVAEERVEPTVLLRVVPKLAPVAYLTASFKRAGTDPLLPGGVQLIRDGVYVGTGRIDATPVGEPIKLGFGEDARLKVDYAPLKTEEGETGTFTTSRMERRETRVALTNLASEALPVQVEDQLPVSEMTDLKIEPLSGNTPPTQTTLDGRRGALAWGIDLKPGETKEIRFGWQARWPVDKPMTWQAVPK